MQQLRAKFDISLWSRNLVMLAITVFMVNFGQGLFRGASTNFFVDTLRLSGSQVLWLAGWREVPGLLLIFIAAATMHFSLPRRALLSLVLMGLGYGLYAWVNSFTALVAMSIIASLGFHNWMPLQSALALSLTTRERSGRVMGAISSVRALAAIVGMAGIALCARILPNLSLRSYFILGGLLIILGGFALLRLPRTLGSEHREQPRILLKRRYWLYYVLTFFEGSRVQVFGTFGTLILVQDYGLEVWQISLILLGSSIVNLIGSPYLGYLLDAWGEKWVLSASYATLVLCFIGYATIHNAWLLAAILVIINLLVTLSMGLSTFVNRIAPREELTPTLSAGVSINHITSVGMSLLAGSLLVSVGYEGLCWGAAAIIALSIPFALAITTEKELIPSPA